MKCFIIYLFCKKKKKRVQIVYFYLIKFKKNVFSVLFEEYYP